MKVTFKYKKDELILEDRLNLNLAFSSLLWCSVFFFLAIYFYLQVLDSDFSTIVNIFIITFVAISFFFSILNLFFIFTNYLQPDFYIDLEKEKHITSTKNRLPYFRLRHNRQRDLTYYSLEFKDSWVDITDDNFVELNVFLERNEIRGKLS